MCSVGFFDNAIRYLSGEYGDKVFEQEVVNKILLLLGQVEQEYKKLKDNK